MIMKVIAGIIGLLYGVYLLYLRIQKHKRIDSEGVATVKEVRKLGRDDGKKVYAIFYDITQNNDDSNTSEVLELCKTPVKKHEKIGKTKTIYFEKDNYKKNYYFKGVGKFDHRLVFPLVLLLCTAILWTVVILQLF